MIVNDKQIVKVIDLSFGGAGVARDSSGRVLFIPYAVPGDLLWIRLTKIHKRYAEGEIVEICEASPHRQTPLCSVFGSCGGCQWQQIPYDLQWETKIKGVLESLKRVQVHTPHSYDLIPAEEIWGYRNRIQLKGCGSQVGFFKAQSQTLIPIENCPIARPELNRELKKMRQEFQDQKKQDSIPYKVELEVLPSGCVQRTWNAPHSASGFRQVHDAQNEKMKSWVHQALSPSEILYDLFGGSGNLSHTLLDQMDMIHCVDQTITEGLVDGSNRTHFHRSSVLPWLLKEALRMTQKKQTPFSSCSTIGKLYATAILDPPRAGLQKDFNAIADALEKLKVEELLFVGCDPDTWAKEIAGWIKRGWKFKRMMLIDLFPQTYHVESLGLLNRS